MAASDDFLDSTLEVTITKDRDVFLRRNGPPGSAMLLVLAGARVGHRVILGKEPCTLGRGSAATLQLEGDAVSRIHARIEFRDGDHYLVDAGSTNGSFVNYSRVGEKKLQDGDLVQIGHVLTKYLAGDNIEAAYHEEFRKLVRRDALTGALNRVTFDEEFRSALSLAERKGSSVCLILFDLDHFKRINDAHGHTAGDLVLSAVGRAVDELASEPHAFARVGGEEFAVLFLGTLAEAADFAEKLRETVKNLDVVYEGKRIALSTSVGVATSSGGTPASVYEAADKQLYRAKESGRDRVCVPK